MNNKVVNAIAFLLGAGIGSVVTWKLVETKYKKLAQEEIDSVSEVYSKKEIALANEVKKAHACLEANTKNDKVPSYHHIVEDMGYAAESEEDEGVSNVYVIPPESYGELDYEEVSLTYYADGVLEDENGNVLEEEDIEEMLVPDFADHFGEWEDDSVFIRNEKLQTDYEILADTRNYSDVLNNSSYGGVE